MHFSRLDAVKLTFVIKSGPANSVFAFKQLLIMGDNDSLLHDLLDEQSKLGWSPQIGFDDHLHLDQTNHGYDNDFLHQHNSPRPREIDTNPAMDDEWLNMDDIFNITEDEKESSLRKYSYFIHA